MKKINILSLFDGIACGYEALNKAGIWVNTYYASEIDKYAISIALKNHPDIVQLGDVNNIDLTQFIGKIDLIMGGSPCQDLSISKHDRKGLQGQRSGLFYRYLEAIKTIKPKYFLLENVASMKKEDKDKITELLGVEPILINSALVSAQQRKRLYWTNIPNIIQPKDKGIVLKDILLSGLGVGVENKGYKLCSPQDKSCCLMARDYKGFGNQQMTGVLEPIRLGELANLTKGQANRIYSIEGKSVCLNANGGGGGAKTGLYKIDLPDGNYIVRKLEPIECERLQTLPDNYTAYGIDAKISNTQRYKCVGNGWTVDVIAHIFSFLKQELDKQ